MFSARERGTEEASIYRLYDRANISTWISVEPEALAWRDRDALRRSGTREQCVSVRATVGARFATLFLFDGTLFQLDLLYLILAFFEWKLFISYI